MPSPSKVQIFGGSGFVGSEFVKQNPDCIVNPRDDYRIKSDGFLVCCVSTIKLQSFVFLSNIFNHLFNIIKYCIVPKWRTTQQKNMR